MKKIFTILLLLISVNLFSSETLNRELQIASRFIVLQKYEDARDILETLYMEAPDNERVLSGLKEVYFGLGENEKLLDLLNNQASREPNNAQVRIDLGKLALVMAKPDEAMKYFEKAFKLYPKNEQYYQRAYKEFLQRGFLEETRDVIEIARDAREDEYLFALDMAITYELESDFSGAMGEYVKYLKTNPDRFTTIERRIDLAGRTDEELEQLGKAIQKMFGKGTLSESRIYRLLSRLNIRLENYDDALGNLISASKNEKDDRKGELVYPFAMQMLDQRNFEIAIEAGEYLKNSKSIYAERGELIMGQALVKLGDTEEAYKIFDNLKGCKISEIAISSKLQIALLDLQNNELSKARGLLDEVIRSRRPNFMAQAIQIYVASYIGEKDYSSAQELLEIHKLEYKNNAWFMFLYGEILLFKGEYDKAMEEFQNLSAKAPDDDDVNDAITYIMLLSKKDDANFAGLIDAIRLWKSDKHEASIALMRELAGNSSNLSLEINWYLGTWLMHLNEYSDATDAFKVITERFTGSFYAPLAFEYLGDIAAMQGHQEEAFEYYQKVLVDYDNAINIVRIREKARESGGI